MSSVAASPSSASTLTSAKFPVKFRRNQPRVRTGCLTCRQRKKKCDEAKPRCAGCTRNKLDCAWPATVSRTRSASGSSGSGSASGRSLSASSPDPDGPGRSAGAASASASFSAMASVVSTPAVSMTVAPESSRHENQNKTDALSCEFSSPPLDSATQSLVLHSAQSLARYGDDDCTNAVAFNTQGIIATWSPLAGSFLSPGRSAMITPYSGLLLQRHILHMSGAAYASAARCKWRRPQNPRLTVILPLAYMDDLLMHCLMAAGGTDLSHEKDSPEIRAATMVHYACALRSLRVACADLRPGETQKIIRVLLVLIQLAQFETMTRDSFGGGIFAHLRACRQLIQWLSDDQTPPQTPDEGYLLGFCQEIYCYLVLANLIVFPGLLPDRDLPLDDDVLTNLSQLSAYPTFGMLFARCHGLWELIPQVAQYGARRIVEERTAPGTIPRQSRAEHDRLRDRILSWRLPPREDNPDDKRTAVQRRALGETLRLALCIFLECALAGGPVAVGAVARVRIQEHIAALGHQIICEELDASPFETVLLWPVMVAGACITTADDCALLLGKLREPDRRSWGGHQAADLLARVLQRGSTDSDVYGPWGVYLTMKRDGINYCMG